jgi:hypothetical protein
MDGDDDEVVQKLFEEKESSGTNSTSDGSVGTVETVSEVLEVQVLEKVPEIVPVPSFRYFKSTSPFDESEYEYSTDEEETATYACTMAAKGK